MAGTRLADIATTATVISRSDLLYLAASAGGGSFLDRKMPASLIGESAFRFDGIGTTPTASLLLSNLTPATLGNQQFSPALEFHNRGFATTPAESQSTYWQIYSEPSQGAANPVSILYFKSSVNESSPVAKLTINSIGQLFTAASINSATNVNATLALVAGTSVNAGTDSTVPSTGQFIWLSRGRFAATSDGVFLLANGAGSDFTRLNFGVGTSAFPAIGRNGIFLEFTAADGSSTASTALYNTKTSGTNFERLTNEWNTNVCRLWTEKGSGGGTARAFVLGADATELMRFESGSKLSFFGVGAVTRPSVPDGSSLATVIDALQSLGLFNTV